METRFLKPVSHKLRIDAPSDRIWDIISSPGNLEYYHPYCESNPVEKWPGEGSIDFVHYFNGLEFVRRFTDWQEGVGYALLIGKREGRKSKVVWRIEKESDAASSLSITIHPHDIPRYSSFLKPLIHRLYITPALRKYLASVVKGLQAYATTGERVRKNQFGTHKWFSD